MDKLIMYIPILLLISSVTTGLLSKRLSNVHAGIISSSLVFVSLILSLFICFNIFSEESNILYDDFYQWISIDSLSIGMGFLIDKLSAMMTVVVLLISFLVHVYSIGYMRDEKDFKRFFLGIL